MAPTVRLLDETLIDQIAAGEVIERPANLVKELVENAIDAAAREITVSLEDGGRALVRVRDDGTGMSAEDLRLSIERHATSKIASFEDLLHVSTLGFRGEALPSIGSVSKMTITTRLEDSAEGTRLVLEGGLLRGFEPAGCPRGTTVEVTDLFYNVPARRKFLRARQTETSKILEICQRMALSHPELQLSVTSDGRLARRYLPARSLAERARQIFGQVALREIHSEREGLILDAVLAPIELARPGARHLFLLVNGRPILDRSLARAVAFAYGDRLAPGCYPRGVVSLRIPGEAVDVNAHPQKTEVRFRRAAELLDQVTRMISSRLAAARSADAYWESRIRGGRPTPEAADAYLRHRTPPTAAEAEARYEPRQPNGLRFVAQVGDRALILENGREVLVVDRARADALIRYDSLRRAADSDAISRQSLLFPDRLELAPDRGRALDRHASSLRSLGFDWSQLGESSYVIRAVPSLLSDAPAAPLLRAALGALEAGAKGSLDAALRALADVAAVPNGKAVDDETARRLTAGLRPDREAYRPCITGRIPLPPTSHRTNDD
ncbi:MAG: DNA mismatch repair endonuclease MutL [Polyangiales bacterium]